jgi:hypothetical protein
VGLRRKEAAALLVCILGLAPAMTWSGALWLEHHGHGHGIAHGEDAHPGWDDLLTVLVHGHQHRAGTPDHEHDLLPSTEGAQKRSRDLSSPGIASPESFPAISAALPRRAPAVAALARSGSSPPRLHLLCTLLI